MLRAQFKQKDVLSLQTCFEANLLLSQACCQSQFSQHFSENYPNILFHASPFDGREQWDTSQSLSSHYCGNF